jgi:hypothetical protein
VLFWSLCRSLNHLIEEIAEVLEARSRNDNGVATTADIFSDAEKSAAGVFLQRQDERFALNLNFFGLKRVLDYLGLGHPLVMRMVGVLRMVAAIPIRRRSFVRNHIYLPGAGLPGGGIPNVTLHYNFSFALALSTSEFDGTDEARRVAGIGKAPQIERQSGDDT